MNLYVTSSFGKKLFQVGRVRGCYIQGNPFAKHKHIRSQKLYPTFKRGSTYFRRTKKLEHMKILHLN
jgi:hypothetical protein